MARFRRTSGSLIEASMDLGADGFQTFRHVILPNIGTALLAGGMLAFALSFDEVIVTTFTAGQQQTLPIWMLDELIRPRQRPVTNVVAIFVVAVTFLPILAAYYLTRGTEAGRRKEVIQRASAASHVSGCATKGELHGHRNADRLALRKRNGNRGTDPQSQDRGNGRQAARSLPRQIDAAVEAAETAFATWSQTTPANVPATC